MRRLRRNLSSSRLETCVVADFPVSKQLSFSVERILSMRGSFGRRFSSAKARDDCGDEGNKKRRRRQRWRKHSTLARRDKKTNRLVFGRTILGVCDDDDADSMTIGRLKGAAIFSNPISRMRCMFFAILRSRMRSNSESPLKFFSSSFSSSLSFAVAAWWCCCPGVVGGENRRIVVVSLIADIFYFFFCTCEKRRFFLRFFFWRESFLFTNFFSFCFFFVSNTNRRRDF